MRLKICECQLSLIICDIEWKSCELQHDFLRNSQPTAYNFDSAELFCENSKNSFYYKTLGFVTHIGQFREQI